MNFLHHRRIKKQLKYLLKLAKHVRDMQEDIANKEHLRLLETFQHKGQSALASDNVPDMQAAVRQIDASIEKLIPKRKHAALRENIEIITVALVVAFAFRTYFLQPFKIPTSSMAPTLSGIQYLPKQKPGFFDRPPLKFIKWAIFGQSYFEVRSKAYGKVEFMQSNKGLFVVISGLKHKITYKPSLHVVEDEYVVKGQLLASGIRTVGDHILVDKLSWQFRQPKRGEITVFKTTAIEHPQIKKNEYYVKRLVGLPCEEVSINEPFLVIDGKKVDKPVNITKIQNKTPGYCGYLNAGDFLLSKNNCVHLQTNQYFVCGDNQRYSLDSRYWGPVPQKNLVGPALMVYWPFTRHWGLLR